VVGAQFALYPVLPALYPLQLRAAGAGAALAMGRIGSIAGPLVAGGLRKAGATPGEVFFSMAPVGLAAAVLLLALSAAARRAAASQGN
jgi:AAHS family 3-hydroxyphenylpropionic acid transporter